MKYTEQEFKFDHAFDLIRYIFSSIFLAPFRFTNELTRKLPYLQQEILLQFNVWAIGINIVLLAIKVISCIKDKVFNPFAGTIPLIAYICSCAFLVLFYLKVQSLSQPSFRKATSEEKLTDKARRAFGESVKPQPTVNMNKDSIKIRQSLDYDKEENIIGDDTLEVIDISDIGENLRQGNITTGDLKLDEELKEIDEALANSNDINIASQQSLDEIISLMENSLEDIELDKDIESAIACDKFNASKLEEAIKSSENTEISIEEMVDLRIPEEFAGLDINLDEVEI